jgi:hypothetical protein
MAWVITAAVIGGSAAAIGGGGAAAIAAGATLGLTTGLSARGQYISGKTQEIELNRQAEEERLAAQSRELQRREELNRALAANVVGQAMSGIAGEGTPASIALASAERAGLSEATIDLSERLRQAALKRQAKSAKQAGYLQATSTLLKTGAQAAQLASTGE